MSVCSRRAWTVTSERRLDRVINRGGVRMESLCAHATRASTTRELVAWWKMMDDV